MADANGDGAPDIVAVLNTFGDGDSLTTLINRGNGEFDDFTLPGAATVDRNSSGLAIAEFNGDGEIDAAVVGTRDDGLEVLFGNGDGTFTLSQKFQDTTDFATDVAAGDLNGDGFADIVDTSLLDQVFNVFLNDGTGSFSLADTLTTEASPRAIDLADLDGDGDLDAAVSVNELDAFGVLINDGSGAFGAIVLVPGVSAPGNVVAGDFDRDGDLDVMLDSFTFGQETGVRAFYNACRGAAPAGCNDADSAEPFATLDIGDVVAFLQRFGAMDPAADFAPPIGSFDIGDIVAFLQVFGQGCP